MVAKTSPYNFLSDNQGTFNFMAKPSGLPMGIPISPAADNPAVMFKPVTVSLLLVPYLPTLPPNHLDYTERGQTYKM